MGRILLGPSQPIINEIRLAAQRHRGGRARVAVAWARDEGVCWLLDALNGFITNLEIVVGINERGTTVEALLRLLQSGASLRVFFKHPSQTFHPKLYWLDDALPVPKSATLIVGSSNLTRGGLLDNYEASMIVQLGDPISPTDHQFLASALDAWNQLINSRFSHVIASDDQVRRLYEQRYLVLERTIRRERRRRTRSGTPTGDLPTAPPVRVPGRFFDPIMIPFPTDSEPPGDEAAEAADPEGSTPLPERFFVRTLTANDVDKLHQRQVGTFEPDLGETARNRFPAFWGWPDRYQLITRQLTRLEYSAGARLISSVTPSEGIQINVTLWFREARPGHAAEHRLRPGPIGSIRAATPLAFDTSSLLVVEQAPEDSDYNYVLRFITAGDPGYDDFATYLTEQRPEHRYGYGP